MIILNVGGVHGEGVEDWGDECSVSGGGEGGEGLLSKLSPNLS